MEDLDLKCMTWNVNGIMKRATDVHSYVIANNVDILVLQEVSVGGNNFMLKGYQRFELEADRVNNTRGLITFVRNNVPADLKLATRNNGTEILCINVYLKETVISIANVYVHADELNLDDLPSCIFNENCLVMGDLNARHKNLGSTGSQNRNGHALNSILGSIDNVKMLGNDEPTHVRGGRIDYALLFNMADYRAKAEVIKDLLSDHFAIMVFLKIEKITFDNKRKRLVLKDEGKADFIKKIEEWYKTYKSINGHNNDENKFYEDLLYNIERILDCPRRVNNASYVAKKPKYTDDKLVKGWSKLLRKAQSNWSKNPSDNKLKDTMLQIAECTSDIRKKARETYWNRFLERISFTKALGEVWNEVNKVRGVRRKVVAHPDPKEKVNELMKKWSTASSFNGLPNNVQACLRNRRFKRHRLVRMQTSLSDESCIPFTNDELFCAIKKGKSTAPGEDGLTYEIINCLISMENSPLLDLVNLSYENGRLPIRWKIALIVPVSKGNGDYRPISLTSCLCKCMERLILNRLTYIIGDQLSPNLFGFIKGKSTSDCVIKVLSNSDAKCRAFIDLKGAFDRANSQVILEELVGKGVKGKLLQWIESYLNGRKAKVCYQGCESEEMDLELGTPQGGVLSPILFNVLMDKIARHNFPKGTQILLYADDIVIQCINARVMNMALAELQNLCLHMGLVINEQKSKCQTQMIASCSFIINGKQLENVTSYKYLGMYIGFNKTNDEINYLKNSCLARLKPLEVLANRGNGVGIPVLRMVYISTIRSIIDYASPLLVSYSENELRPLEVIQNKAMRIILGCPRCTRIEIMRLELNLCSIVDRIQELAAVALIRMIRRGDKYMKILVDKIAGNSCTLVKANTYVRRLYRVSLRYDALKFCVKLKESPKTKPWLCSRLLVTILKLGARKREYNSLELRQLFLSSINALSHANSFHIYCDGSVSGIRAGCGVVIREYFEEGMYNDSMISMRIEDKASITTAELHAMHEGLKRVVNKRKDVFILSDSQSALFALNSKSYDEVVAQCRNIVSQLNDNGNSVEFYWIPSHIGIYLNDVADTLAKEATSKVTIDIETNMSLSRIKKGMKNIQSQWDADNIQLIMYNGSESMNHYLYVSENSSVTYGKALSKVDTLIMRLRLGYKYYWQYSEGDGISCKLCGQPFSHTLQHYIMFCSELSEFRNDDINDLVNQVCHFLNNNIVARIVKKFKNFTFNF